MVSGPEMILGRVVNRLFSVHNACSCSLASVFRLQLAAFLRDLLDIATWVHDVWIGIE